MNEELKKPQIRESEKNTFAKWRTEGLSPAEKSEMRLFLRKKTSASTGSAGIYGMLLVPFRLLSFRQAVSLSAVIALVLASGGIGVAKASERSLPGEILYGVKTAINEPILGLLKRTQEEKALWAKTLSERRMEEANELAVSGKLGEKESQKIENLIGKHREYLERYEDENDDDFVKELDLRSEKVGLKIEVTDGKKRYRIHEREDDENQEEKLEEEKEGDASEEGNSSENEDENEDDLIRKEEKKDDRKKTEKKGSSEKKVELKKQSESLRQVVPEPDSDSDSKTEGDDRDEEEKSDSSGSESGDDDKDDEKDSDSDHEDEEESDSGDDEDEIEDEEEKD